MNCSRRDIELKTVTLKDSFGLKAGRNLVGYELLLEQESQDDFYTVHVSYGLGNVAVL